MLTGILEMRIGDVIQVIYNDAIPQSICQVTLESKQGGDNSHLMQFRGQLTLSPFPLLAPNSVLTITVNDFDLDRSASVPDSSIQWTATSDYSTVVNVNSCLPSTPSLCVPTGNSATVILVETGDSTGQFTGQIAINRRAGNTSGLNGCSPGTVAQVFYTDETGDVVLGSGVKVSESATVLISEGVLYAGGPVTVTVIDHDLAYLGFNNLSTAQVSIPPTATLSDGSSSQSMTLVQTGSNTGYFTGALMTTPFQSLSFLSKWPVCMSMFRPIVSVQRGDTIEAVYSQRGPAPNNLSFFATMSAQSGSILLSSNQNPFIPGQNVTVTVVDADLNTDPYHSEYANGKVTIYGSGWQCSPVAQGCVQVKLADGTIAYTGCTGFVNTSIPCAEAPCFDGMCNYDDFESVQLQEISKNSMNFTGSLLTSTNPANLKPGDGVLFAAPGTLLHAVYLDAQPPGNLHEDFLSAQSAIRLNIAELDSNSAFAYNGPLTLTLFDTAANTNPCVRENATVQIAVYPVLSPLSPKTATIQLQEISKASGTFTNSIFTQNSGSSNISISNGIISGIFTSP